jgi:hypothetical protein
MFPHLPWHDLIAAGFAAAGVVTLAVHRFRRQHAAEEFSYYHGDDRTLLAAEDDPTWAASLRDQIRSSPAADVSPRAPEQPDWAATTLTGLTRWRSELETDLREWRRELVTQLPE